MMATSRIELADRSHSRAILIGTAIYDDDQTFRLMSRKPKFCVAGARSCAELAIVDQ